MDLTLPEEEPPRTKRKSKWPQDERKLLREYVQEFKEADTNARKLLLTSTVLPKYWALERNRNMDRADRKQRRREIKQWYHNVARRNSLQARFNFSTKLSLKRVLAHTQKDKVEAAVRKISGTDPGLPGYFRYYQPGLEEVFQNLTAEELAALEREKQVWRSKRHPPEVQQKTANKYGDRAIRQSDEVRYREMGMRSITWEFHINPKGQLVFACHDNNDTIGEHPVKKLDDLFQEAHDAYKEVFTQYAKYVNGIDTGADAPENVLTRRSAKAPTVLPCTGEGYPILPAPFIHGGDSEENLEDMRRLVRAFLCQNYNLASGKSSGKVPFGKLALNNECFIDDQYLPDRLILQDPSQMKRYELEACLKLWRERQVSYPSSSVFRWKGYLSGTGSTKVIVPTTYPAVLLPQPGRNAPSRPCKKKSRAKQKARAKSPSNMSSSSDEESAHEEPTLASPAVNMTFDMTQQPEGALVGPEDFRRPDEDMQHFNDRGLDRDVDFGAGNFEPCFGNFNPSSSEFHIEQPGFHTTADVMQDVGFRGRYDGPVASGQSTNDIVGPWSLYHATQAASNPTVPLSWSHPIHHEATTDPYYGITSGANYNNGPFNELYLPPPSHFPVAAEDCTANSLSGKAETEIPPRTNYQIHPQSFHASPHPNGSYPNSCETESPLTTGVQHDGENRTVPTANGLFVPSTTPTSDVALGPPTMPTSVGPVGPSSMHTNHTTGLTLSHFSGTEYSSGPGARTGDPLTKAPSQSPAKQILQTQSMSNGQRILPPRARPRAIVPPGSAAANGQVHDNHFLHWRAQTMGAKDQAFIESGSAPSPVSVSNPLKRKEPPGGEENPTSKKRWSENGPAGLVNITDGHHVSTATTDPAAVASIIAKDPRAKYSSTTTVATPSQSESLVTNTTAESSLPSEHGVGLKRSSRTPKTRKEDPRIAVIEADLLASEAKKAARRKPKSKK